MESNWLDWCYATIAYLEDELVPCWVAAESDPMDVVVVRYICNTLRRGYSVLLLGEEFVCQGNRFGFGFEIDLRKPRHFEWNAQHTVLESTVPPFRRLTIRAHPDGVTRADVVIRKVYAYFDELARDAIGLYTKGESVELPWTTQIFVEKPTDVDAARKCYTHELDAHLPPDLARIVVDDYLLTPQVDPVYETNA